jgi:hypothetical protein
MRKFLAFVLMITLSFVLMAEINHYQELRLKCGDNATMTNKIKNLFKR